MNKKSFIEDIKFAKAICEGDEKTLTKFQDEYKNLLMHIATEKLVKRKMKPIPLNQKIIKEELKYQDIIKKSQSIKNKRKREKFQEDVSHAYKWLNEKIQKESCNYKAKGSFDNYILTIVNSELTFLGYDRSIPSDQLVKMPPRNNYVPVVIQEMGSAYVNLYRELLKNKSEDEISKNLNMSFDEVLIMVDEISRYSRVLNVLPRSYRYIPPEHADEGKKKREDISEKEKDLIKIVIIKMEQIINHLTKSEKRFIRTYWDKDTDKLLEAYQGNNIGNSILDELEIYSKDDVYGCIKKIVKKALKFAKKEFPDFIKDYKVDETKLRRFMSIYVQHWYEETF